MKTIPMNSRLTLIGLIGLCIGWFHLASGIAAEEDAQELLKQYDGLKSERYYRNATAMYDKILRFSTLDSDQLKPQDQFLKAYFEGDWDQIQKTLDKLPQDFANTIYDRIVGDLAGRTVPVLTLQDFLGLADACPTELNDDRIRKLGLLLRIAVAPEQEVWLQEALQKGTRHLGRDEPKRTNTGRILMHAGFDDLARDYLPSTAVAAQIEDEGVRDEILNFLSSQEELEQFQQTRIAKLWEQQSGVLLDPNADSSRRQQAADQLADLLGKAPSSSFLPWIRDLLQKDQQAVLQLAIALGKRAQGKLGDYDIARRTYNLDAQKAILQQVGEHADLSLSPWETVATTMADWWVQEAEHTFENHPSYRNANTRPKPCLLPGDLLTSVPDGAWLAAIPISLRDRVDVCVSKAVLISDHYPEVVQQIIELGGRNPKAGVALAEEYLKAWAFRHSPEIPEAVRKKYGLASDARIAVTPIMMEKNIASLAEMMDLFRKHKIPPKNAELLVAAFDVCYSNAEVYQRSHLEKVFGSVSKMDEGIFLNMIRMMIAGLASRWRTMEVQVEAGTRRTQQETLDMVRAGYRTAIEMIDERCQEDRDSWRLLALAGSLQSDWADFEYYQQLASDSPIDRMEAFRVKNLEAESYFVRAAEAYAREIENLTPGQYSIDVYLAWFHSLLGINSDGRLNLSKPLDRRALNALRETIRKLPEDVATNHLNRFAKHVQSRLEDTEKPLHEQLKYKYLAGSLVITKENPFAFQADEKLAYYDQLLEETRLTTRVDGSNTIHRNHDFGILLSVQHTEALGRMADFGKYLVNELPPANSPQRRDLEQRLVATYQMGALQGRRDELEMNIREALGLFFDVRAIAFSPKDVQPRPIDQPGWEETILAYIQVKAKDASVDKIPRIQMSLEFLDLTGPVKITAESPETLIKVTDQPTAPRPFDRVEMTQTLDQRSLDVSEEILLQIEATASGLVPELEDLLDLEALREQLPIARIDPHGGIVLQQVNSWGDTVHAVSTRRWTLALDATSLVDPPQRIQLRFPKPKIDATVTYRTYDEMDLIDLDEPIATAGSGIEYKVSDEFAAQDHRRMVYIAIGIGAALLALVLLGIAIRKIRSRERPLRARDVFHLPAEIDGFAVVQLLRALNGSELVRLSTAQRSEMQQDLQRIQAACFGSNGSAGITENELRQLAKKWLRTAC